MEHPQNLVLCSAALMALAAIFPLRRSFPLLTAYWLFLAPYSFVWQTAGRPAAAVMLLLAGSATAQAINRRFGGAHRRGLLLIACWMAGSGIAAPLGVLLTSRWQDVRPMAIAAVLGALVASAALGWLLDIPAPAAQRRVLWFCCWWWASRFAVAAATPLCGSLWSWKLLDLGYNITLLAGALVLAFSLRGGFGGQPLKIRSHLA